jgi:hypothetical protein
MQVGKKGPGVYDKALSKAGRCWILVESKGKIERLLGGASSAVGMCMVYCAAFEHVLQTETHAILPHLHYHPHRLNSDVSTATFRCQILTMKKTTSITPPMKQALRQFDFINGSMGYMANTKSLKMVESPRS